jgi:hypothetical protein
LATERLRFFRTIGNERSHDEEAFDV